MTEHRIKGQQTQFYKRGIFLLSKTSKFLTLNMNRDGTINRITPIIFTMNPTD